MIKAPEMYKALKALYMEISKVAAQIVCPEVNTFQHQLALIDAVFAESNPEDKEGE
ncbi:MAG: hypothetical protein ACFUZC_04850 [Chthoniobacteraceae bacterium]